MSNKRRRLRDENALKPDTTPITAEMLVDLDQSMTAGPWISSGLDVVTLGTRVHMRVAAAIYQRTSEHGNDSENIAKVRNLLPRLAEMAEELERHRSHEVLDLQADAISTLSEENARLKAVADAAQGFSDGDPKDYGDLLRKLEATLVALSAGGDS